MKIQQIKEVFVNYFGEDRVDLQHNSNNTDSIIIYWNKVTVTNENDQSIDIFDLYAKVDVDAGFMSGNPTFVRSTYTALQWHGGYIHSHIPKFYPNAEIPTWRGSCLGRGPIISTISRLNGFRADANDPDIWTLFCFELDKYVHVESLSGGPHYKMEKLYGMLYTNKVELSAYRFTINACINEYNQFLKDFIPYLLDKNVLPLSYNTQGYRIGLSKNEIIAIISNTFIDWFNENRETFDKKTLCKMYDLTHKGYYTQCDIYMNCNKYALEKVDIHSTVLIFKGKVIRLKVLEDKHAKPIEFRYLYPRLIITIVFLILQAVSKDE